MTIALIDTSIMCNLLNVPNKNQQHTEVIETLTILNQQRVNLLLPIASIFETGNHIAKIDDGRLRYDLANKFQGLVLQALAGDFPFKPIATELTKLSETLPTWLAAFPDYVQSSISFADTTIISEFDKQCTLNPQRRVYIWAYDGHLSSYDRPAS